MASNSQGPPTYTETVLRTGQQQRRNINTQPRLQQPRPQRNDQLLPKEMQPNDYLGLTIVIAIVCGLINITTLLCSVPAVISSVRAFEKRYSGEFKEAKRYGNYAAVLIILCLLWVMVCGIVIVGVVTNLFYIGD